MYSFMFVGSLTAGQLYPFYSRINPVKVFLHVFPSIHPIHVAAIALLLMVYIFITDVKALVYSGLKTFFHSILSIFFRSVDVVGRYAIRHMLHYGLDFELL